MDGAGGALLARSFSREEADRDYFLARAEAELDCAQRSMNPGAVRSHYTLAGLYLDLVYNDEAFKEWKRSRSYADPAGDLH